jgi:uncharacterized coiled-coil protein SlyX
MNPMALEPRIAHLEGTVAQIGERLNAIDSRVSNLERKVDALGERLDARIDGLEVAFNARFNEMDRRFTWVIGLVIVSIIAPLVQHAVFR